MASATVTAREIIRPIATRIAVEIREGNEPRREDLELAVLALKSMSRCPSVGVMMNDFLQEGIEAGRLEASATETDD